MGKRPFCDCLAAFQYPGWVFCLATLSQALQHGQPEIFNTDQGMQFTAHEFTHELETAGIRISMDGRGRFLDNIFVERLWRMVMYEDIYIKAS